LARRKIRLSTAQTTLEQWFAGAITRPLFDASKQEVRAASIRQVPGVSAAGCALASD
jgi:hypothetical protein